MSDSMDHHRSFVYEKPQKVGLGIFLLPANQLNLKMMIFHHANATYVGKQDTSHLFAGYARERVYLRQRKSLRVKMYPVP